MAFRLGALNVQGWARKQKEVEATATQFDLDALFCSETRGREPGWLEADGYRILRAESKAWWASTSERTKELLMDLPLAPWHTQPTLPIECHC